MPLSVLFADVRGYTKLTQTLAPAEVPALVNRFYEIASAALLRHEGLLGQIEGDNVMCIFVPGLAGREYRRSAVEGGCELVRAVGPRSPLALPIGVGIASGEEYVGNVGGGGYKDFTAVGDVTNLAARLTAQAAAGEIVVDIATFDGMRDAFPDATPCELDLRGRGSVAAWRIAG